MGKHHDFIITGSFGDFTNRLRVLTTYYHIAQKSYNSCHLYFVFDTNDECPSHFLEVFESLKGITFISRQIYDTLAMNAAYASPPELSSIKTRKEILNDHKISYSVREWNEIRRNLYKLLVPSSYVKQTYKMFIEHYNICNISAINIKKNGTDSAANFVSFIESRHNESVFLMTNDKDTQIFYRKKYPNKILVLDTMLNTNSYKNNSKFQTTLSESFHSHPTESLSSSLPPSIAPLIIEIYIAAHSKVFLGSKYSLVTETIRLLKPSIHVSNCRYKSHTSSNPYLTLYEDHLTTLEYANVSLSNLTNVHHHNKSMRYALHLHNQQVIEQNIIEVEMEKERLRMEQVRAEEEEREREERSQRHTAQPVLNNTIINYLRGLVRAHKHLEKRTPK